ncbi:MAG: non-heme iron oxygenase ferredoxin subunit [Porticoccaceae bacterium]|nr:non-heme iron oxygenase ferredoxin subunit [Porticoccaceae bacterium]
MTTDDSIATDTPWVELGDVSAYPPGSISEAKMPSGATLAIFNVDGEFYASFDRCTHAKASFVEEGELNGHVLECGWHHGTFDVRTGAALTLPCRTPLITFATKIDNNKLFVNPKPNRRAAPPSAQ